MNIELCPDVTLRLVEKVSTITSVESCISYLITFDAQWYITFNAKFELPSNISGLQPGVQ